MTDCTFPRCGCSEREQCRPVKTAPALDLTQFEGHTPGPWWTDARYSEEECGCAIIAARTDCGPLPGNPTRGMVAWAQELLPENKERCAANARLIAAAPDLLEALEVILGPLNVCSDNPNVRDDTCLPIDLTMGELRQARAAIAKARGAA